MQKYSQTYKKIDLFNIEELGRWRSWTETRFQNKMFVQPCRNKRYNTYNFKYLLLETDIIIIAKREKESKPSLCHFTLKGEQTVVSA